MIDATVRKRSEAFNEVAEIYDAARPSYPGELIDDIIQMANLPDNATILDVGTGTGIGTIPFAKKGYAIHCIEPGDKLIAIAFQNLRSHSQVTFETTTFEDWQCTVSAFDLVISAQAFHWVDREISYPKAAKALKEQGHIALFWNFYTTPDTVMSQALSKIYQKYVPSTEEKSPTIPALIQKRENWITNSKCFINLVVKQYPWSIKYSAEQHLNLLKTQTGYQGFTETEKQNLSNDIVQVINTHGGYVTKKYLSVLFFAQKP